MKTSVLFTLACLAVFLGALFLPGIGPAGGGADLAPFGVCAVLAASLAACAFFFGLATGDYSWVDRIWSLAPVAFAWILADSAGFEPRLVIAALLITLWSARLTANFARRGGYTGTEDYRWSILRGRITNPVLWQLFNALFICGYQIFVLLMISAPLVKLRLNPAPENMAAFVLPAAAAVLFLALETKADQDQWAFQARKARQRAALERGEIPETDMEEDVARGFCSSGLFRYSRHPNYFGELGFWWSVYFLGLAADPRLDWTLIGPLALTAIFVGSTRFTESITASKYPAYREYQQSVSAIIPLPPRRGSNDTESAEA